MTDADSSHVAPPFLPGLELSRAFYGEVVQPILDAAYPSLRYSAALLGTGSEILGFDTERSTDHHWGPRLQLFLSRADHEAHAAAIAELLAQELPLAFCGYATNWGPPLEGGVTQLLVPVERGPIRHRVDLAVVGPFMRSVIGFDPRRGVTLTDWLVTPSQLLLSVTAGAIYHDGLGELGPIRAALAWYPHDLWLYLIACGWKRISQEEAFVGRCAEVSDELGSRLVAGRLIRDLIKLCFLLERRYAPYSKWLGTAFATLPCAPSLHPAFEATLAASDGRTRERHLAEAYERIAVLHNALGITAFVDPATRPYHDRPFRVLHADRFVEATREAILDESVRRLDGEIGSIDQFVDSTDVLSSAARARRLAGMWP